MKKCKVIISGVFECVSLDYIETEIEINIPTIDGLGFDSIVLSKKYKKGDTDEDNYVLLGMNGYLRHFTNGLSVALEDVKFRFKEQEISDIGAIISLLGSENWKLISGYLDSRCLGDSFRLAYHVDIDDARECLEKDPFTYDTLDEVIVSKLCNTSINGEVDIIL